MVTLKDYIFLDQTDYIVNGNSPDKNGVQVKFCLKNGSLILTLVSERILV